MKNDHVIVVGGGLAGLTAAIYLARGGKKVTLFERSHQLGGRAITQLHDGFRFNLGPHALYRGGKGMKILREIGITFQGKKPPTEGIAIRNSEHHDLPGGVISLVTTTLLTPAAKLETIRLLAMIARQKARNLDSAPLSSWIDDRVKSDEVRGLIHTLFRLTTYSDQPQLESAAASLRQLQSAIRHGVLYIDEGWQTLVDGLRAAAISSGVNFVSSARVVAVSHNGRVEGIELGELQSDEELDRPVQDTQSGTTPLPLESGASVKASAVVLALPPRTTAKILGSAGSPSVAAAAAAVIPVKVASLDLALRELPQKETLLALGIDRPIYFSVHSASARLAPARGAMLHAMRYLREDETGLFEQELETIVDELQPGWRELLVKKRFLPRVTASNAMVTAAGGGLPGRTPVRVPEIENLFLAGDWVGDEGMLSDASFASARKAAMSILS